MRMHASQIIRASLFTFAASALALTSACSVASGPDGAHEATAEETIAQSSAELATTTCRGAPLPAPHVCGTYVCDGDGWILSPLAAGLACKTTTGTTGACSGVMIPTCLPIYSGTITPKFYVVSVEYSPPGAASTVDYGMGSTWGTTLSNTSSFENTLSVTVSNSGGFLGFAKGGLSLNASQAQSGSTKDTEEIKTTLQTDFTNDGDSALVDHGLDRIYLWLDPVLNVSIYSGHVNWSLGAQPSTMLNGEAALIYVTPDWLLGVSPMPSEVALALSDAGITPADYASILGVDPFAGGATGIDSARYVFQTQLPYEPVTVADQKPTASKFALSSTWTSSTDDQSSVSYTVGAKISGSAGFIGVAEAALTVSDEMKLSSTNQKTLSNGSTLSASASITQPGYGYTGPIYLNVYLDTVYNTFLFALTSPITPVRGPGPIKPPVGKSP